MPVSWVFFFQLPTLKVLTSLIAPHMLVLLDFDSISIKVDLWTQVQLRLATVTPDAVAILEEIDALQPWTMSWSNVGDYYSPAAFFAMARRCSREEDTVHYMHSMNWVRDVKVEYRP